MLVPYIRSSFYGGIQWCPFKAYLEYNLGLPNTENFKARKGTLVHKAMEILAKAKLAQQENQEAFTDEECGKTFPCSISSEEALQESWDLSKRQKPEFPWSDADFKDCQKWMNNILGHPMGLYDPRKRDIFAVERFFDIPCHFSDEKESRKWSFVDREGKEHSGEIRLRGTMDLLALVDASNCVEYIDYKTGKSRQDWSTGKEKTLDDFKEDFQLLFYFYALTKIYPQFDVFLMTLYFAQAGGPFTVMFSREDIPKAEKKIKKFLDNTLSITKPERILGNPRRSKELFKCTRLCHFYESGECESHYKELQQLGILEHTKRHANVAAFSSYTGGGKTDVQCNA